MRSRSTPRPAMSDFAASCEATRAVADQRCVRRTGAMPNRHTETHLATGEVVRDCNGSYAINIDVNCPIPFISFFTPPAVSDCAASVWAHDPDRLHARHHRTGSGEKR